MRKPDYQRRRTHVARRKTNVPAAKRREVAAYDLGTHSHLLIKRPPESINILAAELALPQNATLAARANKGKTFEECIGILAADLDIALDDTYTPEDIAGLAEVLVKRMRDRHERPNQPHLADSRLVNAELVERGETFTLEEVGRAIGAIAPGTGSSDKRSPYTVCDGCTTSFECCFERDCKAGKPAAQLGETVATLRASLEKLN